MRKRRVACSGDRLFPQILACKNYNRWKVKNSSCSSANINSPVDPIYLMNDVLVVVFDQDHV